jgi:DNA-binding NarL/FixJ family response regulator
MANTKVLIVDDHAIVREGIRMILALHPDIEVIGEASDGLEAIDRVNKLTPDVVLMDMAMPGLGGLEATLEIMKLRPQTRIIVLTQYDDTEYIYRFLKAGVAGYVLKKAVGNDLVTAIRSACQGKSFIDPQIADKVIKGFLEQPTLPPGEIEYEKLSDREKEVLKLIAEGRTARSIADALNLSVKTIMTHRANLMEKLNLHNRAELIKYAVRHGLVSD